MPQMRVRAPLLLHKALQGWVTDKDRIGYKIGGVEIYSPFIKTTQNGMYQL